MISIQDVVLGLIASCLPSLIAIALLNYSDALSDEEPLGARAAHPHDVLGADGCAIDDRGNAIAGRPARVTL